MLLCFDVFESLFASNSLFCFVFCVCFLAELIRLSRVS